MEQRECLIYYLMDMESNSYIYSLTLMSVIKDERLTSLEKLLLIHIVSFCKKKDYCWATNKYFCDIYKVSRQTISKSINNLAKLDYIRSNYTRTNINASKRKIMLSDRYKEQIKSIKDNLNTGIKL